MSDQKKDLTGIMDFAKSAPEESPSESQGISMDWQTNEKIDSFESLEDFGKPEPESGSEPLAGEESPLVDEFQATLPEDVSEESALENVRRFSEELVPSQSTVPASFPFSLLIEGPLAPEEKARLIDIISREDMGFREVDLELQLASDRVLIPRISEYAGVMLVSALRATRARMRLGPSDSIFSTADTQNESGSPRDSKVRRVRESTQDSDHVAESIPVIPAAELPGGRTLQVMDVVTASATLRCEAVNAEGSSEYQELLDRLIRELKYKAHHKGAKVVLNFSVKLDSAGLPSRYRMLVMGTAAK
jgi:hypothetical protein